MDNENMEIDHTKLAMRIKEVRRRKGITQERLAQLTDLTPNFIGRIESLNSKCSLATLVKISIVLETSTDYLLQDSLRLTDNEILNVTALNDTERKFIANTIRGIKEIQAELIEQLK